MFKRFALMGAAAFLLSISFGTPLAVRAAVHATFTVNSDLDQIDRRLGDGVCKSKPSNKCTLRAAIQEANALGGKTTISLPGGAYFLTRARTGEDSSKSGDLDVNAKIIINGDGMDASLIDGSGSDRVFDLISGSLTLNRLTVRNGDAGAANGGGVNVRTGALKAKSSQFLLNTADTATGNGGGIYSKGKVILKQTRISNNSAHDGAGLYIESGRLEMTASVVNNNTASGKGALYSAGTTILTNSTVSENDAVNGGGIYADAGTVSLYSMTIATNAAANGGGINNAGATVYLRNSIVESNTAGQGAGCLGTLASEDYNIFNPSADCNVVGSILHNRYNVASSLGNLQDNGGPTLTLQVNPGSPALDGGNPSGCKDKNNAVLTTDQRGRTRPTDGDGSNGARCDIGAFELDRDLGRMLK